MINYKAISRQFGLAADHGMYYGEIGSYTCALIPPGYALGDRRKFVSLTISAVFGADTQSRFADECLYRKKEFGISEVYIISDGILVGFPVTGRGIADFLYWFPEMLDELGAQPDLCPYCRTRIEPGDGVYAQMPKSGQAIKVHPECENYLRDNLEAQLKAEEQANRETVARKSVLRGAVGALLGAAVGSVLWIIVALIGYYVYIVGLAVGLAADFGYRKLGGKEGLPRMICVLAAVIVIIPVDMLVELAIVSVREGFQLSVFPEIVGFLLKTQAADLVKELVMGYLFALVPAVSLIVGMKTEQVSAARGLIRLGGHGAKPGATGRL